MALEEHLVLFCRRGTESLQIPSPNPEDGSTFVHIFSLVNLTDSSKSSDMVLPSSRLYEKS